MILYTLYFTLFLFGLSIGSFLNAVIFRLEKGDSVIFKKMPRSSASFWKLSFHSQIARSHCSYCRRALTWYDLIPVLSFVLLGSRCRHCNKKISWQYPAVEITTGILFILIYFFVIESARDINFSAFAQGFGGQAIFHFQTLISSAYYFYIASVLIIIFVYDLKHFLIPDKILFPAVLTSIMYHVLSIMIAKSYALYIIQNTLYSYLGSALLAAGFFLLLFLLSSGRAMGFGDVKLAFLMGLILGWPDILVALFLAFLLGAVVGIILILTSGSLLGSLASIMEAKLPKLKKHRYSFKSKIPFAPFLIIGTFIALFWGSELISMYLNMFI